ncbi:uncharacterized protein (TIGR01732 family) [Neobacillus drentensis]|uniref:YjcZ family sporulation protein n=1 Tax=Neobacillus drentensis TaxID=220684 RepID=UPI00285A17F7|nr:uncharacterized protein (TIGR01732 family) [Neobacillus drentensis]
MYFFTIFNYLLDEQFIQWRRSIFLFCTYFVITNGKEALYVADGGYGAGFALIVVLFILLIIIEAALY